MEREPRAPERQLSPPRGDSAAEPVRPSQQQPTTESGSTGVEPGGRLSREALLDLVTGAGVLVVYVIVQVALLQGPRPLDAAKYFDSAAEFPDIPIDWWTLRIGLLGPVRAAVLVFGPSEAAFYAVPIAVGLVLAAAVYGTMLLLFRDRILAAAAALVTVLNTGWLFTSSQIYPDTTATATFTAGFFFLVLAKVRSEREDAGWAPTAAVVCAGLLFGWTYLVREFSVILFPAVLAAVVLLRYPVRRIGILVGAALAAIGLELLYGFVRFRDPFVHAELLLDRNEEPVRWRPLRMEYIQDQLDTIVDTMAVFPRLLVSWNAGWVFLLLPLIFLVALVRVRDRRLWVLAAWCFSYWATLVLIGLGELPSGRWILNVTNVRYWYLLFPPLVMGAFGGLGLLARRSVPALRGMRLSHPLAVSLAVLVLVPGLVEYRRCAATDPWGNDPMARWHDLRDWLATPEAERYRFLWTDWATQRLVPAYTSTTFGEELWRGSVKTIPHVSERIAPTTDPARTLILVHKDRLRSIPNAGASLKELRGNWSPVFVSDDGRMIALAHEPTATSRAAGGNAPWWSLAGRPGSAKPGNCGRSPYEPSGPL